MTPLIHSLVAIASDWNDSSQNQDPRLYVVLFLLMLGPIVYGVIYARYRNPGARYMYEQDTSVAIGEVKAADQYIGSERDSRNSVIPGANSGKLNALEDVPFGGLSGFIQGEISRITHDPFKAE
jgi:hypothetical protein